ncbi:MAG: hypothetical protein K0R51_2456 [Cytophagaceae bacterium]|jgi:hypothetical protein|nr:hypothetical protein [Cytophagaceae bacterium]
MSIRTTTYLKPIAQAGLVAKGIVYTLLGVLTFMAAFHINGKSTRSTDKEDVFAFVYQQTGGQILLGIIALGLFSYCIWRGIQAISDSEHKGNKAKGLLSRARYLLSGLVYGYMAVHVSCMLLSIKSSNSGDGKQEMAREMMNKPLGQWLVGLSAIILLGVGIYQIYYGLSEKYKKHVEKLGGTKSKQILWSAGKIGYTARGMVWLMIAWLFAKAAFHENSSEAGGASKAFGQLHHMTFGPYLLAIMGVGLMCYGMFSFIRARYENL